jgi:hypothetical protein
MTAEELFLEAVAIVRSRRRHHGEPAELFEQVAVR